MTRGSVWTGIALGTLTLVSVTFLMVVVALGPSYACQNPMPSNSASSGTPRTSLISGPTAIGSWNAQQVANAAAIVATAKGRGIPPRGWVIALATAMQESTLKNLANSNVPASLALPHEGIGRDHDSVGLFQQRPLPPDGQGAWGTVAELMTPTISAAKFYTALTKIPNWESRPLSETAQAVQRSAFPDAYAKWEPQAAALAVALAGVTSIGDLPGASLAICGQPAAISAGGWTPPVKAGIVSPFGPRGGGFHYGIDLGASRNTAIRAASDGRVIYAACDPSTGNCDIDGSPGVPGCGYYVEILHAGNVATRYCHLVRRPDVTVGQNILAGHVIGLVGSSGNSSGPHLHFEVHTSVPCGGNGCGLNSANAVDPAVFMRGVGASLES